MVGFGVGLSWMAAMVGFGGDDEGVMRVMMMVVGWMRWWRWCGSGGRVVAVTARDRERLLIPNYKFQQQGLYSLIENSLGIEK
ncbi:hypothetical protein Tco_1568245 [Tanacetum coccineum]